MPQRAVAGLFGVSDLGNQARFDPMRRSGDDGDGQHLEGSRRAGQRVEPLSQSAKGLLVETVPTFPAGCRMPALS